ncbi:hypothetical protein BS78_03G215300 [Paspalum vaginatum]|nr:hypothetical protein BS78_03G215300 [Paspalum vaginatum]
MQAVPMMSHGKSTSGPKDEAANLDFGDRWRWVAEHRDLVILIVGLVGSLIITVIALLTVGMGPYELAKAATADVAQPHTQAQSVHASPGRGGARHRRLTDATSGVPSAVDADWIPLHYRYCSGGGNSMLRVSYHDMILAWGHIPWFCVEDAQVEGGAVDGVFTVEANAEAAVMHEEVRGLVQSDLHLVGKSQFAVQGEVMGLGISTLRHFPVPRQRYSPVIFVPRSVIKIGMPFSIKIFHPPSSKLML